MSRSRSQSSAARWHRHHLSRSVIAGQSRHRDGQEGPPVGSHYSNYCIERNGCIDIALQSLKYGAEDYLVKGSIDTASLGRCINYALTKHAARATDERFATIVEGSEDAIIGMALNGTITSWNNGASRLFGYTAEEAIGISFAMIIPPEASPELATILKTIGETIHNLETIRSEKKR